VSLAILCSGQARQHAGMFDLVADSAAARPVFECAQRLFGDRHPSAWVRSAGERELFSNQTAQLLCCTQALAAWSALGLDTQTHEEEWVIAGYSVGELAAWGCAGVLAPCEVLRLATVRAQAMDGASTEDGGLASVRGLSRQALEAVCREDRCEIAILLGDDSFVVGGTRSRLQALTTHALEVGAQRCVFLPIGVAAHTSLMRSATAAFASQLSQLHVSARPSPNVRLLSGIDGAVVYDVNAGLAKLAAQISQPLDWHACLTACQEAGATRVLELGPGNALARMARETMPAAQCRSLEDFKTLGGIKDWLARSG
jgi:[acyl-carrier-protein] S-malonyltransferase